MPLIVSLGAGAGLGLALGALILADRLIDLGIPLTILRPAAGATLVIAAVVLALRIDSRGLRRVWRRGTGLARLTPPAAALIAAAIGVLAFAGFASSADEWGYLFGAMTLAGGRLTGDPLPDAELFRQVYILQVGDVRVTQYLPGWPALLALPLLAQLPPVLVSALALGAMLVLLHRALVRVGGRGSWPVLLAAAASPMLLLNGATLFNHVATTAAALVAVLALLGPASRGRDALAGAAWSVTALMRLDVAIPLAVVLACAGRFGLDWRRAVAMVLGALPGLAVLLGYNALVTGNPLTPPTVWGGNLALGAGGVVAVEPEFAALGTWGRIAVQTAFRLAELSDTFPLLLPLLWLALLPRRILAGRLACHDAMLPATVVLFAIFPDYGGFQIGPRYWFTGLIIALIALAEELRHRPRGRGLARAALVLGVPAQLALTATQTVHLAGLFAERRAVFDLAAALPGPAVVVIGSHASAWDRRFNRNNRHAAQDLMRNPPFGRPPVRFVHAVSRDGRDLTEATCRQAAGDPVLRFVPAAEGGPRLRPVPCPPG